MEAVNKDGLIMNVYFGKTVINESKLQHSLLMKTSGFADKVYGQLRVEEVALIVYNDMFKSILIGFIHN